MSTNQALNTAETTVEAEEVDSAEVDQEEGVEGKINEIKKILRSYLESF